MLNPNDIADNRPLITKFPCCEMDTENALALFSIES